VTAAVALALLAGLLAPAATPPIFASARPDALPSPANPASGTPTTAGLPARRTTVTAPDSAFDPSPGFDVLSYDLSLGLRAGIDSLEAVQRITVRITSDSLRELRLELRGLTVDSGAVGGTTVRVRRHGDTLLLPLPSGVSPAAGDTLRAWVAYHGRPTDGLIMRRDIDGAWTVFADNWPDRARYWFASVDHPADKAAVTIRVTVPADWTTVANGIRTLDLPLPGGRRRQVWVERASIPVYTMVVGAGRLAVEDGGLARAGPGGAAVPIHYVVFPEDSARGPELFGAAARIVEGFARRFGPFPYPKLDLVQSATRYGGMENAGAIFFAEQHISDGTAPETEVAHEIAHQWFGDGVTEARWSDIWLSEGFASFGDALWQEISRGPAAYRKRLKEFEDLYLSSDAVGRPILGPVPADLTRLLDANAYQKGAWVLAMLRRAVGDSAFFDGLRRYFARYHGESALTGDFQAAEQDASGRDLSWFFDQWLRRPGAPSIRVSWSWSGGSRGASAPGRPGTKAARAGPRAPGRGTGGVVELSACQVQEGAAYRISVPVRLSRAGGADTTVVLRMRGRSASLRVSLDAPPDSVTADPENTVLGPVRAEEATGSPPACAAGARPGGAEGEARRP